MTISPDWKERIQQARTMRAPEPQKNIFLKYGFTNPRCGIQLDKGWMSLFETFLQKLFLEGIDVKFEQVKQKLGGLRVYATSKDNSTRLSQLITELEKECSKTCEHCGIKAKEKNLDGYLTVLCLPCSEKYTTDRQSFWKESDA